MKIQRKPFAYLNYTNNGLLGMVMVGKLAELLNLSVVKNEVLGKDLKLIVHKNNYSLFLQSLDNLSFTI